MIENPRNDPGKTEFRRALDRSKRAKGDRTLSAYYLEFAARFNRVSASIAISPPLAFHRSSAIETLLTASPSIFPDRSAKRERQREREKKKQPSFLS